MESSTHDRQHSHIDQLQRRRHGSCLGISGSLADIAAIAVSSPVCRLSRTHSAHTATDTLDTAQTAQMRCQNSCVYG